MSEISTHSSTGAVACLPRGAADSEQRRRAHKDESTSASSGAASVLGGPRSLSTEISCPLCKENDQGELCELKGLKEIQAHFSRSHWKMQGFACHYCGTTFSTADGLLAGHSECAEWMQWRAAREAEGVKGGKLKMTHSAMLLGCADCGWYKALTGEGTMDYLKTFFSHHNNDGLLGMIIKFPGNPSERVDSIRFTVKSMTGEDAPAPPPCSFCDPPGTPFQNAAEANEHYIETHSDKALTCEVCERRATTEHILGRHQLSHVHDNALLAEFLSNSALILPPPGNKSCPPRRGWKNRAEGAVGSSNGASIDGGETSARGEKKKGRVGTEKAAAAKESGMASRVREKLNLNFGHCMRGFEGVWLTDAAADVFTEWMAYWESDEGREEGGPKLAVDVSPSFVPVPSEEIELQLLHVTDVTSGFLLNDNIFYCKGCDSVIEGVVKAKDHLRSTAGGEANRCALAGDDLDEDPLENSNICQLFSTRDAATSLALACPYCPRKLCSIAGLRVHVLAHHGLFAKCERDEDEVEVVAEMKTSKATNRTRREGGRKEKGRVNIQYSKPEKEKGRREGGKKDKEGVKRRASGGGQPKWDVKRGKREATVELSSDGETEVRVKNSVKKVREEETEDEEEDEVVVRRRERRTLMRNAGLPESSSEEDERMEEEVRDRGESEEEDMAAEQPADDADPPASETSNDDDSRSVRVVLEGDEVPAPRVDMSVAGDIIGQMIARNQEKRAREAEEEAAARERKIKRRQEALAREAAEEAAAARERQIEQRREALAREAAEEAARAEQQRELLKKQEEERKQREEGEMEGVAVKPVRREFTPADDDDDLCVVAEVDNTSSTATAAAIKNQREKKFGCPMCSDKFITRSSVEDHIKTSHKADAGQGLIDEELGIPLASMLYICRPCCLAFPNAKTKNQHTSQHIRGMCICDECSSVAYNAVALRHHHERVAKGEISYVCGRCELGFDNDICLHEHSKLHHAVDLFYFCKECEVGSTDGLSVYQHFLACPKAYGARKNEAAKHIGVCPARQLHFQPNDLEEYKSAVKEKPHRFARPSICSHRSLGVAAEQQVSCDDCYCLTNLSTYRAGRELATGRKWEPTVRDGNSVTPLAVIRAAYERGQREIEESRRALKQQQQQRVQLLPVRVIQVVQQQLQLQPHQGPAPRLQRARPTGGTASSSPQPGSSRQSANELIRARALAAEDERRRALQPGYSRQSASDAIRARARAQAAEDQRRESQRRLNGRLQAAVQARVPVAVAAAAYRPGPSGGGAAVVITAQQRLADRVQAVQATSRAARALPAAGYAAVAASDLLRHLSGGGGARGAPAVAAAAGRPGSSGGGGGGRQ